MFVSSNGQTNTTNVESKRNCDPCPYLEIPSLYRRSVHLSDVLKMIRQISLAKLWFSLFMSMWPKKNVNGDPLQYYFLRVTNPPDNAPPGHRAEGAHDLDILRQDQGGESVLVQEEMLKLKADHRNPKQSNEFKSLKILQSNNTFFRDPPETPTERNPNGALLGPTRPSTRTRALRLRPQQLGPAQQAPAEQRAELPAGQLRDVALGPRLRFREVAGRFNGLEPKPLIQLHSKVGGICSRIGGLGSAEDGFPFGV